MNHTGQKLVISDLSDAVKVAANDPTERIEFTDDYKYQSVFFTAPEVVKYL